ncbi:Cytochrome P450 2F3 [Halotydeus destructor]|nr:Cytochrome P450 2F3 [Halotydeus destructor]
MTDTSLSAPLVNHAMNLNDLQVSYSALLLFTLVIVVFTVKKFRPGNRIPGPHGVPFLGYLPFIGANPVTRFLQLAQQYGAVYRLSFLARDYYVVSGFPAIKEYLSQDGVNDRLEDFNYFSDSVSWDAISALNGSAWKQQRKFILSKVFSMSVLSDISPKMVAIGDDLVKYLKSTNGRETNLRPVLSMTTLNTISSIVCSKQYDWDDEQFKRLRKDLLDFIHCIDPFFFMLGGPYLKTYMMMFHRKQHNAFLAISKRCLDTATAIVNDKHGSDIQNGDFAGAFLKEHQREVDACVPLAQRAFTLDRLARTIFSLMRGGTDTAAEALYYVFYFMARYPAVQARVRAEVDAIVGRDRRPTLGDKSSLTYTRAVIEESLRVAALLPMGVPRQIDGDIKVAGHTIPRGSYLVHNLYSIMRDKTIFENADQFCPEHFLDIDGHFVPVKATVSFGYGRRNCIGETLARNEMFVYLTTVLQNFVLSLPSGQAEPKVHEGLFRLLDDYNIIATPR